MHPLKKKKRVLLKGLLVLLQKILLPDVYFSILFIYLKNISCGSEVLLLFPISFSPSFFSFASSFLRPISLFRSATLLPLLLLQSRFILWLFIYNNSRLLIASFVTCLASMICRKTTQVFDTFSICNVFSSYFHNQC